MTPRKLSTFRIDDQLLEGLEKIRDRETWSVSWQVREAIKDWLKKNAVAVKAPSRSRGKRERKG
jgi:hypothetical protein